MNKRLITVFAFALLVAGGASLVLYKVVSVKMSSHSAQPQKRLVSAVHALEIGTLIRAEDIQLIDWPRPDLAYLRIGALGGKPAGRAWRGRRPGGHHSGRYAGRGFARQ